MESFKIDNFRRDHPGRAFPDFTRVTEETAREIKERLRQNCGLAAGASDLDLARCIAANATNLAHAAPEAPRFDVASLLRELSIAPQQEVLINWFRYDEIDRMRLEDLSRDFADIWYPGSDDIEIFDDTCAWVLVVPHSGNASVAVLSVPA